MKKIILTLFLYGSLASAQVVPSITAYFTGYSEKTNYSYRITQSSQKFWKLEVTAPCPAQPCTLADHTTETVFSPILISDPRMEDGNTEVFLLPEYRMTFVNKGMVPPNADGSRAESYWKLTVVENHTVVDEVKLSFVPQLKTQD